VRTNEVKGIAVPAMDVSKVGIANAHGFREYGLKYWLRIAG
jgi:hypothetical protein